MELASRDRDRDLGAAMRRPLHSPEGNARHGSHRSMIGHRAVSYVGVAGVAAWLGVKPQTVTKWLRRYGNVPESDAYLAPGRSFRMWLPEREAEWRAWARSRPGRGAPGRPRRRRHEG